MHLLKLSILELIEQPNPLQTNLQNRFSAACIFYCDYNIFSTTKICGVCDVLRIFKEEETFGTAYKLFSADEIFENASNLMFNLPTSSLDNTDNENIHINFSHTKLNIVRQTPLQNGR